MHDHVPTQFLSEGGAPDVIGFRLGTVDAVCEFDNTQDGQRNLHFAVPVMHALKNGLDALAATFAGLGSLDPSAQLRFQRFKAPLQLIEFAPQIAEILF